MMVIADLFFVNISRFNIFCQYLKIQYFLHLRQQECQNYKKRILSDFDRFHGLLISYSIKLYI
jgi:hypothetical protein